MTSVKFKKDGFPVALKLPKTLGACADTLFDLKEARLAQQKIVDALAAQESEIKNHIINTMPKSDSGAAGKHHQVRVVREEAPRIGDDAAFYAYVKKHGAFDMLQRSLNAKAVRERMEGNKGKSLPGVEMFGVVKVSLTKVG
jgi:hypothetical protein